MKSALHLSSPFNRFLFCTVQVQDVLAALAAVGRLREAAAAGAEVSCVYGEWCTGQGPWEPAGAPFVPSLRTS